VLQLSLFDQRDMAEITSPDYPGERPVVCRNPLLAEERRRKRDQLLALTEADLSNIEARVRREKDPLRGAGAIGKAVGAVLGKRKMAKHFEATITELFAFTSKTDAIAEEVRFDGFYVLRTSLSAEQADTAGTVRAYKSLAHVERAFRCMKTVDLDLRPVFHWTTPRVRAHVLLCMLAYYLEWHAPAAGADAVRRPRPAGGRGRAVIACGQGQGVAGDLPEGVDPTHQSRGRRNTAGAQLSHAAGRSGDIDPQHRLL